MTLKQRLMDYRRQYEDTLARKAVIDAKMHELKAELRECEVRGEIAPDTLMRDLRDTEAWQDWVKHDLDELETEIRECEAAIAAAEEE